mmetsp:Transcript_19877/g.27609  ORF Transcript_19877/g.27609 Transcript_19877/m.27609 type:complete len:121 (+) Transcript_19877:53-415(+)
MQAEISRHRRRRLCFRPEPFPLLNQQLRMPHTFVSSVRGRKARRPEGTELESRWCFLMGWCHRRGSGNDPRRGIFVMSRGRTRLGALRGDCESMSTRRRDDSGGVDVVIAAFKEFLPNLK